MRKRWWVARQDMTLNGQKVHKGQLVRPSGAIHDRLVFRDESRLAYEYHGSDPEPCGTDGCNLLFEGLGTLQRHRKMSHGPEREYRELQRKERQAQIDRAEAEGETIGGVPVVDTKGGPGGPVPYIANPLGA